MICGSNIVMVFLETYRSKPIEQNRNAWWHRCNGKNKKKQMLSPSSASVYLLIHVYSYRRVRQAAWCTITTTKSRSSLTAVLSQTRGKRTASRNTIRTHNYSSWNIYWLYITIMCTQNRPDNWVGLCLGLSQVSVI